MTRGGRLRLLVSTVVLAALTAVTSLAEAFDPERTFTPGAFALSLGGGLGEQAGFSVRKGTNLRVVEIDSSFAFRLYLGVGASLFVTDRTAIYAGYRMVHVSNGNTSQPNRGFEANTGVLGVSFYFP